METSTPEHTAFKLPDTLPVIVLEECYLFPGCFLPLFIFEQRYRQMLDHALGEDRMFCVGTRLTPGEYGEILPVSTAGLIRASRRQDDGTSNVMLYGVTRIRLTGWTQMKPFRIATIEPVPTLREQPGAETVEELRDTALKLLPIATTGCPEGVKMIHASVTKVPCPDLVCDILSYHFVHCPAALHELLAEPVLEKRYRKLIQVLKKRPKYD